MIPFAYINEWREAAPWDAQVMVEQDLIISRIVVELFSDPVLRDTLIFRGGTALNKLCFPQPLRYSEDVDLAAKLEHPGFAEDCVPLLRPGTVFDPAADAKLVEDRLLSLLPNPKTPAVQRSPADERPQP